MLEKVAADYADKGVVLAKINVDENSFIASQFQVRSIPTVYAIYQRQPVADLTNARTEAQLATMLDQLLEKLPIQADAAEDDAGPDIAGAVAAGDAALAQGAAEEAYAIFTEILAIDADNRAALSGMLQALLAMGRTEEARAIHASLPDDVGADPVFEKVTTLLTIAAEARDPEELQALRSAVDADPANHTARFDLANGLMAAGDRDGAADALLDIIAADRDWNEGAARARLLEIFGLIGLEDPWVAATRRRLSAILFG